MIRRPHEGTSSLRNVTLDTSLRSGARRGVLVTVAIFIACSVSLVAPAGAAGRIGETAPALDFRSPIETSADFGLDPTFGSAGVATVPFEHVSSIDRDREGRIVLGGPCGPFPTSYPGVDDESDFCVVRIDAGGTLDLSFGTSGLVRVDFSDLLRRKLVEGGSSDVTAVSSDSPRLARIAVNGNIVVVGDCGLNLFGPCLASLDSQGHLVAKQFIEYAESPRVVGQTAGFEVVREGSGLAGQPEALLAMPDSTVLFTGACWFSTADFLHAVKLPCLGRLASDGAVDQGFGLVAFGLGSVHFAEFGSLALDSSGHVLAATGGVCRAWTGCSYGPLLMRIDAQGNPDSSFGENGVVGDLTVGGGAPSVGTPAPVLAVQPDRRVIVVGGGCWSRLAVDGTPDTTFGDGGCSNSLHYPASFTIVPDGRIVALGADCDPPCIWRMWPNGDVDVEISLATLSGEPGPATGYVHPTLDSNTMVFRTGCPASAVNVVCLARVLTGSGAGAPALSGAPTTPAIPGMPYSFAFTLVGSPAPMVTVASGSLPPGLLLSVSGVLSGTPTTRGTYAFTLKASNGVAPDAVSPILTIEVRDPSDLSPTITCSPSGLVEVGASLEGFFFCVNGSPVPSVTYDSGALPPGVSVLPSGELTGQAHEVGAYQFTVRAHNGVGDDATATHTIVVWRAPTIAGSPPATARVGEGYDFAFTLGGYPNTTMELDSGTLPPGIDALGSGHLQGIPLAPGSYAFTLKAQNTVLQGAPAVTPPLTIVVTPRPVQSGQVTGLSNDGGAILHADGTRSDVYPGAPVYTGDVLEAAPAGWLEITLTDGTKFSISSSSRMVIDQFVYDAEQQRGSALFTLLRGLFIYTSGLIAHNDPAAVQVDTPQSYIGIRGTEFIVRATGDEGREYLHLGRGSVTVTSKQSGVTSTVEAPESAAWDSAGVVQRIPLTQALYDSMRSQVLSAKPNLTARLTNDVGSSTTLGSSWTWNIQVTNSGTAAAVFGLGDAPVLIDALPPSGLTYGPPSVIAATGLTGALDCDIGTGFVLTCSADGPLQLAPGGVFDVRFTATPSATRTFGNPESGVCAVDPSRANVESAVSDNECSDAVTVTARPATVAGDPISPATVGEPYNFAFTLSGMPSPIVSLSMGTLPPGLVLSPSGVLSGTPTTPGTFSFAVKAANGVPPEATTPTLTIRVVTTARSAKRDAKAQLSPFVAASPMLGAAATSVDASLEPSLWTDDGHLSWPSGLRVFGREFLAARQLGRALAAQQVTCSAVTELRLRYMAFGSARVEVFDAGPAGTRLVSTSATVGSEVVVQRGALPALPTSLRMLAGGKEVGRLTAACTGGVETGDSFGPLIVTSVVFRETMGAGTVLTPAQRAAAEGALGALVEADRLLATTALRDAEGAPPPSAPLRRLAIATLLQVARSELAAGATSQNAGAATEAIEHFARSWLASEIAMEVGRGG